MGFLGRLIGGGLGFSLMGPIGGIIGYMIGSSIDSTSRRYASEDRASNENWRYDTGQMSTASYTPGDFAASLVVLFAAIAAADKKVTQDEYNYIQNYFRTKFGGDNAADLMSIFREIIHKPIDHKAVALQVKDYLDYYSRLQLLQMLYGLAQADGKVDIVENNVINQISFDLGIDSRDQVSIRSIYFKEDNGYYKTLGITKDATDEEIKKAYRSLVTKYHPDKVSHLGQEFVDIANEKFIAVKEAYDNIRKERNF